MMDLETKPDFEKCMQRIYAWYEGEIIDRVPVRFSNHNSEYDITNDLSKWKTIKNFWFDYEYQLELFEQSIKDKKFLGETFPVYMPNLGPNVYASFLGCKVEFSNTTSWSEPIINDYNDLDNIKLDYNNEYFTQIEKMTRNAIKKANGRYFIGYTDLHPGIDCAAALRDNQELCLDFYDNPKAVVKLLEICSKDFHKVYNYYDDILKYAGQPSVTWMNIPSFEKMHIPSADFSALISNELFDQYCLPIIQNEVKPMTHNVFHLDGKGVANHIESILQIKEIQAIQWVQGVAEDKPIAQWIPLIKKIQAANKGVVIDIDKTELDLVMNELNPKGIYLCVNSNIEEEQKEIISTLEKWKNS